MLITHCASAHWLLRLGSLELWGCGKKRRTKRREPGEKVVKILTGRKILEVGEDPADQPPGWRCMLWSPTVLG